MVKLSIIIPVFKVQEFIGRCIESVLNQTFADFELLLIDDGSPDLSGEICDKYALSDTRINVIHQKNQGVSVARNNGLDHANGDFIVFIDSDDWIEPLFLETYFKELAEHPSELVYQGFINDFKDRTTLLKLPNQRYKNEQITEALFEVEYRECLGGACNKIFRRDIIEEHKIRFDTAISYGEDKIFTLQYCMNITSISLLDSCYYHYNRTMVNSLSNIHHSSEKLIHLIEIEYSLFKLLNDKFANVKFIEAARGRYVSIHKYVLISMYRPHALKNKSARLYQMEKISHFMSENVIDNNFDRDVPKIAHLLINSKNDLGLTILMWMRHNFVSLYSVFRYNRS